MKQESTVGTAKNTSESEKVKVKQVKNTGEKVKVIDRLDLSISEKISLLGKYISTRFSKINKVGDPSGAHQQAIDRYQEQLQKLKSL